eukprot:gb/GECH01010971.1/.p1 GENE.gb/GECH01010971.1/~~gb/GECH01010971.1/.p1  ORF type:complete len:610 (+),score=135.19 gb/GECH01010971.1/:1-1830(+)
MKARTLVTTEYTFSSRWNQKKKHAIISRLKRISKEIILIHVVTKWKRFANIKEVPNSNKSKSKNLTTTRLLRMCFHNWPNIHRPKQSFNIKGSLKIKSQTHQPNRSKMAESHVLNDNWNSMSTSPQLSNFKEEKNDLDIPSKESSTINQQVTDEYNTSRDGSNDTKDIIALSHFHYNFLHRFFSKWKMSCFKGQQHQALSFRRRCLLTYFIHSWKVKTITDQFYRYHTTKSTLSIWFQNKNRTKFIKKQYSKAFQFNSFIIQREFFERWMLQTRYQQIEDNFQVRNNIKRATISIQKWKKFIEQIQLEKFEMADSVYYRNLKKMIINSFHRYLFQRKKEVERAQDKYDNSTKLRYLGYWFDWLEEERRKKKLKENVNVLYEKMLKSRALRRLLENVEIQKEELNQETNALAMRRQHLLQIGVIRWYENGMQKLSQRKKQEMDRQYQKAQEQFKIMYRAAIHWKYWTIERKRQSQKNLNNSLFFNNPLPRQPRISVPPLSRTQDNRRPLSEIVSPPVVLDSTSVRSSLSSSSSSSSSNSILSQGSEVNRKEYDSHYIFLKKRAKRAKRELKKIKQIINNNDSLPWKQVESEIKELEADVTAFVKYKRLVQ